MCSCSLLDHLMLTLYAFVAPVFPPHVWSFTMFASLYFSLISTKLVFILSWVFLSVLFKKKKKIWLLNKVPFWGCVGILKKAHTQLRIFFFFLFASHVSYSGICKSPWDLFSLLIQVQWKHIWNLKYFDLENNLEAFNYTTGH